MRIKLADIFVGERVRKDYGKNEMEDLKRSMDEDGQITAVTVRPPGIEEEGDEEYSGQPWVLVAGGRRLLAAGMLGWEDIEGYAREEMSWLTHRTLELHENLKRKSMSPVEELESKAEIARLRRLENPDITDREIAKELGETPANLSRDLKAAKLLEEFPELKTSSSKGSILNTGLVKKDHQRRMERIANQDPTTHLKIADNLVTADAFDYVQTLDTDTVDLCLIDGPYGIDYWQMSGVSETGHLAEYDDRPHIVFKLYEDILPDLVRATRETGWIVFFCSTQLERELRRLSSSLCTTCLKYSFDEDHEKTGSCSYLQPEEIPWVWVKPNASSSSRFPHLHAKNKYETILPINMGKGRLMVQPCENVLTYDVDYRGEDRVHGVQRPLALLQDLVRRFTYPGDLVIDCFYGSGSSLAAAASLGRRFGGSDKNPALRELAIGYVTKYYKPVAPSEIAMSEERFKKRLEGEGVAPPPRRAVGLQFEYETLRMGNKEFLTYIKYDGHNMAQFKAEDQDTADHRALDICDFLGIRTMLGTLDPVTCSVEDVQDAIKEFEEAEKGSDFPVG